MTIIQVRREAKVNELFKTRGTEKDGEGEIVY